MNEEWTWEQLCMTFRGRMLTGVYAHACPDWDELPIDETCDEWPCVCAPELIAGTYRRTTAEGARMNAIIVGGQIVTLQEHPGLGYSTPDGYCRLINGKPCGCSNAWVLRDGSCPCAPGDLTNPVCRKEPTT